MLATNHGLTGMILGATLATPLAIPVAFASHFVLDSLPHYGVAKKQRNRNKSYKKIVYIDTAVALTFAVVTAMTGRWDMFWIGWVSYGPDGYWVYLHFKQNKSFNLKIKNRFARFHEAIQFERPWGLYLELPVAAILFTIWLNIFIAS